MGLLSMLFHKKELTKDEKYTPEEERMIDKAKEIPGSILLYNKNQKDTDQTTLDECQ